MHGAAALSAPPVRRYDRPIAWGTILFGALLVAACGPAPAPAGTLPPLARPTRTLPPIASVDDTTIEHTPLNVLGGATVEFFGRSRPGATIEVITGLPYCTRSGMRLQTARSQVPPDGSYRVAIRTEPHWTQLQVSLRFIGNDQSLGPRVETITILPAGRPAYCIR